MRLERRVLHGVLFVGSSVIPSLVACGPASDGSHDPRWQAVTDTVGERWNLAMLVITAMFTVVVFSVRTAIVFPMCASIVFPMRAVGVFLVLFTRLVSAVFRNNVCVAFTFRGSFGIHGFARVQILFRHAIVRLLIR